MQKEKPGFGFSLFCCLLYLQSSQFEIGGAAAEMAERSPLVEFGIVQKPSLSTQ